MSSSEQKVLKPCEIDDLADEDLANIFKLLPPYERLLVSEVSKRWYGISRIPWRDVRYLDLSSIPGENVGAIINIITQCPNLETVFAKDKALSLNQLQMLTYKSLSSVKLYGSLLRERLGHESKSIPPFSAVFSKNLPNANWRELVLDRFTIPVVGDIWNRRPYIVGRLPPSLERLQITGVRVALPQVSSIYRVMGLPGLAYWGHLTCLSLCVSPYCSIGYGQIVICHNEWRTLKNLRELCLGYRFRSQGRYGYLGDFDLGTVHVDMPRLEVLFLNSEVRGSDDLGDVITKHPKLRILCVTGPLVAECTIPVRRRFPNGFGSDPLPKLDVFVGKRASESIVFTKSSADALEIHPITEPLPEFLAKEEIAPFFEGIWLAAQIKESAKHGSNWWQYEGDTATSFRTADDA